MITKVFSKAMFFAAVIVCVFAVSACGTDKAVSNSEQAEKTARYELAKMQEQGILSKEIVIEEELYRISEREENSDKTEFFGRVFEHRYSIVSQGDKYAVNLSVDSDDGKISSLIIEAKADENDEVINEIYFEEQDEIAYYYSNFDDLFRPDMTIDELCEMLTEYWGFSGYTLSGTKDDYYSYDTDTPDGSALLNSICDEPYLTVYFDGDQENVPRFIELVRFPSRVCLVIGTLHLLG